MNRGREFVHFAYLGGVESGARARSRIQLALTNLTPSLSLQSDGMPALCAQVRSTGEDATPRGNLGPRKLDRKLARVQQEALHLAGAIRRQLLRECCMR